LYCKAVQRGPFHVSSRRSRSDPGLLPTHTILGCYISRTAKPDAAIEESASLPPFGLENIRNCKPGFVLGRNRPPARERTDNCTMRPDTAKPGCSTLLPSHWSTRIGRSWTRLRVEWRRIRGTRHRLGFRLRSQMGFYVQMRRSSGLRPMPGLRSAQCKATKPARELRAWQAVEGQYLVRAGVGNMLRATSEQLAMAARSATRARAGASDQRLGRR